jgi:hypothetical protein
MATCSSETSSCLRTTRCYNEEQRGLHSHCLETLTSIYIEYCFLICDVIWPGRILWTFRRYTLPPASRSKSEPSSNKQAANSLSFDPEDRGSKLLGNVDRYIFYQTIRRHPIDIRATPHSHRLDKLKSCTLSLCSSPNAKIEFHFHTKHQAKL